MKILIIEDSEAFRKVLLEYLNKHLFFASFNSVATFEELQNLNEEYDLYICDYTLPDAINGEHIDYLLKMKKHVIVLTSYPEEIIKSSKKDLVVDFLSKSDLSVLFYLKRFIGRLYKNQNVNVLVVDDSSAILKFEVSILKKIFLNVYTAKNGKEALEILYKKNIDLIITDLNMPEMDGEALISKVRRTKNMSELPMIVISGNNDENKLIKTLKIGANDYLKKPFLQDELIVRVNNILDIYDNMRKIKLASQKDPLTGVYNRLFLDNSVDKLFELSEYKSVAMLDIDFFKKINDTYGHQTGDAVLKCFTETIKNTIRKTDYIIRYGGEEFLIFMPNTSKNEANIVLHKIRNALKPCEDVEYTFSAGIADEGETISEMIKIADKRLYEAKKTGRNKVVIR